MGGLRLRENNGASSLVELFLGAARRNGEAAFLWHKVDGAYRPWSWALVEAESAALARFLIDEGLSPGDRVMLVADSRAEWVISDLAIMRAGGITVPSYTTYTTEDYRFVLEHSGARFVIMGGGKVARELLPAVEGNPAVRCVLGFEGAEGGARLRHYKEAIAAGMASSGPLPGDEPDPDRTACFIYTSGTGGRPKSVMLSHRNILANVAGTEVLFRRLGLEKWIFLSFLPLSHAYEHTIMFLPMAIDGEIYFAESVERLASNLVEVRPTILPCVPRLYEVLRMRVTAGVERQGALQRRMFELALALGTKAYERGGRHRLALHERILDGIVDRLVRSKVKERFGGRLRAMVSGGAPLNYEVGLFFAALGLPVCQGYGQTESSPIVSVNPPWAIKLDTVGPPLHNVEVRIAEDREILIRGDLVMQGYWNDPEATANTIRDGWLHTGDVGEIDADGYLKITDRKKDIIVNSGGDNLSPQRVEGALVFEPEIDQAVVYGDRKPHLVALIHPAKEALRTGDGSAAPDERARQAVGEAVARVNRRLSSIERVRQFEILSEPFSIENGLMTPTLKPRRSLIYERFRQQLEGMYDRRR